jgi:hypothetical protein
MQFDDFDSNCNPKERRTTSYTFETPTPIRAGQATHPHLSPLPKSCARRNAEKGRFGDGLRQIHGRAREARPELPNWVSSRRGAQTRTDPELRKRGEPIKPSVAGRLCDNFWSLHRMSLVEKIVYA